jgi:hypothetical protein
MAGTIRYPIPSKNYFLAAFVLGEKAVAAAEQSTLPELTSGMISNAKPYLFFD